LQKRVRRKHSGRSKVGEPLQKTPVILDSEPDMGVARKLIHELHRRSIWQVLLTFAGGSWVALEVIAQLTETAGLPDWVPTFALVLLLIGLPMVVATAFVQEGLPGGAEKGPRAPDAGDQNPQGAEEVEASAPTTANPVAGSETGQSPDQTQGHTRLFTWQKAILGGVGAFSLLGVAVAGYFVMRLLGIGPVASLMAQGVLEERDPVVLADFQNHSTDPSAGDLVTEMLRMDLVESRVLTLAPPARVQEVLGRMGRDADTELTPELSMEVAEREGLKAVIQGEVTSAGEGYVLTASLVATESGEILKGFREAAASPDDLVNAIDKLSERIREKVGESLMAIRGGEPLWEVTTSSIEALRKYADAMRLQDRGESMQAISLLKEATQIDTAFAMAHRKQSVIMANLGLPGPGIREAATRAYNHRERLGDIERYLTVANYHEKVTADWDTAIRAYRNVLRLNPHERTALNNLALRLMSMDRFDEAQPLYDTAMAVTPFAVLYLNATRNLLFLGDTTRAIEVVERFEREHPRHPRAVYGRFNLEVHRGDSDRVHEAASALGSLTSAPLGYRVTGVAGGVYADRAQGKWREAQEHMREAARFAEVNGSPTRALAWSLAEAEGLLHLVGDTTGAQRKLKEILASGAFEELEPPERPWSRVVADLINSGLIDEAQEYSHRWETELAETDRGPGYLPNRSIDQAYLELASSGDVDGVIRAIHEFRVDARCVRCLRIEEAELEVQRGRVAEAIGLFERLVEEPGGALTYPTTRVLALERLGPLYEEVGEPEKAADAYRRFAEAWKDADPELHPRVQAALEAAARLRAEEAGS
jgi:tetratricopeptide (TPR) repeat protein